MSELSLNSPIEFSKITYEDANSSLDECVSDNKNNDDHQFFKGHICDL